MASRRVFISFLGTGVYKPTLYAFPGVAPPTEPTSFVQAAIIKHFKQIEAPFSRVHMLLTPESKERNWGQLERELNEAGLLNNVSLTLTDNITSDEQETNSHWEWFRQVLDVVNEGDDVVFDFTHGFRSVPIVLSAALSLLQRTKPFTLCGAYYGFASGPREPGAIWQGSMIDMAPFYEVNQWSEAIGSLVDSANADPLAHLARASHSPLFTSLRDPGLQQSLTALTAAVKDVDVHTVGSRAADALSRVKDAKAGSTNTAETLLLDLVIDKFADLGRNVGDGAFDLPYFQTQLILADKLIEHGMHMQAFTVMSEMIVSLGLLARPKYLSRGRCSDDGVDKRIAYGNPFLQYAVRGPAGFDATRYCAKVVSRMRSTWTRAPYNDAFVHIQAAAPTISKFRNGFNHAWTGDKHAMPASINENAARCKIALEASLSILASGNVFKNSKPPVRNASPSPS